MQPFAHASPLVLFYVFAFAISWFSWAIMYWVFRGEGALASLTLVFSTLGALGPLLALGILEKRSKGGIRLLGILSTIRVRGVDRRWFVPAILAVPVLTVIGNLLDTALGGEDQLRLLREGPAKLGLGVWPAMLVHFAVALFTSPLFEEPGWRGFALPRLQRRYGRELGSLAVGVLWWLWHQPMNMTFGIAPSVYGFLLMVSHSFIIDSLFNLSGRNLASAMLTHQSQGTTILFLHQGKRSFFILIPLIAFVVVLRLREWKAGPVEEQATRPA